MFSRRAPFTGRTSGRGFRVRVATNEWMDRRRITEPPPLLPVSPPVIETVLFPGLSWEYRQDFLVCPCCAQVEGGFTLVTLSFSEALYPNRETNYYFDVEKFSFHFNDMVQKDSKSYLSTYEFRFHIITRFLTSTGFALGFRFTSFLVTNHSVSFQPRKRAREGRKFSLFVRIHESVEGESGQGWPLSRAPPALVRCHWAHATRSLACQAIITVLATARVRAVSLSRRKATDQVNIANRCIVASVNSISRPTDPASLRSLPLSSASAGYNKSTFFFFLPFFILLEKKDPFDSRSSWIDLEPNKFTENTHKFHRCVSISIRKLQRSN